MQAERALSCVVFTAVAILLGGCMQSSSRKDSGDSGDSGTDSGPGQQTRSSSVDYSHYDFVLSRHLSGKGGLVDYKGLLGNAESMSAWNAHLAVLASAKPEELEAEDRKAFWLNAYNTFCLQGILANYPVDKPTDVEGFFDKIKYDVAGQQLTVNQMQYETLMPEFKDARLHFALVCSDFSCLPLEDTAFTGADLEPRLVDLSYRFARDSGRFKVDLENGVVHASKLFDEEWYAKDFKGDPARPAKDAVQYMAPWVRPDEREFLLRGEYRVEIAPWDWRVNEWRPEVIAER